MEKLIPMINEAGSHWNGRLTRKCDAVLADGVFVKTGSDGDHVAVTTAPTENPLGLAMNATDAAEDDVGVELPGAAPGTKVAIASAAIAAGARVCPTAAGKVVTLPTDTGTYYVTGRAITAADADDDKIEIEGCTPYPVVVD